MKMRINRKIFLILVSLLLVSLLIPACQKKYELDNEALLKLQCNASDVEDIIGGIGQTSEETTAPTETEPTEANEPTEETDSSAIIMPSEVNEPSETTVEETEPTAKPTAKPTTKPTEPTGRVAPVVTAVATGDGVLVSWNKIASPDLVGYKVVASVSNANPKYSEDGYYSWITNANTTSCLISNGDGYNGGDVCSFSGGTDYYFSVTAVYGDEWVKIAGNAIKVTMPGEAYVPTGTYPAVEMNVPVIDGDSLTLSWGASTDTTGFVYYKVMCDTTSNPTYPANHYIDVVSNPNTIGGKYSISDLKLDPGTYYLRITTVYYECVTGTVYASGGTVHTIVIP
jgi:hypothetical protein